jgi:serine/threonine protein kinase
VYKIFDAISTFCASPQHPFIVVIHGYRADDANFYLLLELCTGGDLCGRLDEVDRLGENTVAFYAAQLACALDHLHR